MKMKKITASRWAILAFVLVCLVAVFSTSGCSMLTDKMNQVKCGDGNMYRNRNTDSGGRYKRVVLLLVLITTLGLG